MSNFKVNTLSTSSIKHKSINLTSTTIDVSKGNFFKFVPTTSGTNSFSFINVPEKHSSFVLAYEGYQPLTSTPFNVENQINKRVIGGLTMPGRLNTISHDGVWLLIENKMYELSTPWDLNTAQYRKDRSANTSFYTTIPSPREPMSLAFSKDGTNLYIAHRMSRIYQYGLANSYDLSNMTYIGEIGVLSPTSIAFNKDGTVLTVFYYTSSYRQYQYTLSNP